MNEGSRLGRKCSSPSVNRNATSEIKNIRHAGLPVKGPRLFNILPVELRNLCDITVEEFKRELNRYLTSIPDEPLIPGFTAMRITDSNSLQDIIPIS